MPRKPLVLITNDDGLDAPGLIAAHEAVKEMADVWVIAPREEYSSCGHAITLLKPIFCKRVKRHWFAIDGTPADCVFVACSDILPSRPDFVVSGINHGPNLGKDTYYSGTVAAAREAAFRGIPSAAVSIQREGLLEEAGKIVEVMTRSVLKNRARNTRVPAIFLNVNIPAGTPKGIRLTRLGRRIYRDSVVKRRSPRHRTYYWINGGPAKVHAGKETDGSAVAQGYISVTPLNLDQTDGKIMGKKSDKILTGMIKEWSRLY